MHLINIFNCTFCTILCFIIYLDFSSALRDVRVQIPHAVKRGEKAILKCLYDLEGDSLYSVKWYRGRREFYSFTPKETPAMKVFQFAGVKVDRSFSNESQLVLEAVNAATSGKYSCEVSADAPSFHTLIGAGELEVVVPGKDPVITGIRSRYKVGDIVRGNCTSSHSRPAANITWTVNGYETNPAHIRHFKPLKDPRELETVISAIHFVITPQHFIYGKLKIRCTAHIHDVYWKSTEKSIEENRFGKAGSVNVVQTFSEDYFDLEEGNVVDRSDTYMTHIKGDVSSLNASGSSALHKCSCFWPRLTTLSLILYAVQQMFQLLQQLLFGQQQQQQIQTIATTTAATVAAIATKQSMSNCRTIIKRQINTNKEKDKIALSREATATTATTIVPGQQNLSGFSTAATTTQVAAICDTFFKREQRTQDPYWPKEKYFQIKLIKNIKQSVAIEEDEDEQQQQQLPLLYKQKQATHFEYLKQECDKMLYKDYNLTMTTQVANIFNVATIACVVAVAKAVAIAALVAAAETVLKHTLHICHKTCFRNHNLYAQCCKPQTPPYNTSSLTTDCATFTDCATISTAATSAAAVVATSACNLTSKDFFLNTTTTTT